MRTSEFLRPPLAGASIVMVLVFATCGPARAAQVRMSSAGAPCTQPMEEAVERHAQAASDPLFEEGVEAPEPDPLFDDDELDRDLASQPSGFPDPLEGANRAILRFNRVVDRYVLDPVTRIYDAIVPEPMEPAIRRSFQHFGSAAILLNDILQLRPGNAAETAARFVVNSTVGVAGLFDFARCEGLVRHSSDFGQTLAGYGVGSGPYLILPVLGPSNVRDAIGDVIDAFLHPARYFLGPAQALTYGSSAGLATRERHYHSLNELEKSAVDFYAALRNAYYQARMAEIHEQVDRDIVGPQREEYQAPCTATLAGHEERLIGPRAARGLSVRPVSRWTRLESP